MGSNGSGQLLREWSVPLHLMLAGCSRPPFPFHSPVALAAYEIAALLTRLALHSAVLSRLFWRLVT